MSTVCPFCKAPVAQSSGPCARCGREPSEHPSIALAGGRNLTTDFDDDEDAGDLVLERGSPVGTSGATSAYEGSGGTTFDSDLFDDEGPGAALELDVPRRPPSLEAMPAVRPSGQMAAAPGSRPSGQMAAAPGSRPSGQMAAAPGSRPSGQMAAVPGSRPSGQMAAAPVSRPSGQMAAARSSGALPPSPPSGDLSSSAGGATASGAHSASSSRGAGGHARPPANAAALIARYPDAPGSLWQSPLYAARVLRRQLELRQDLSSLRRRRSPDVPLYEAALEAHDRRGFAVGLAISGVVLAALAILFFLPVILRFARD